MENITFTIEDGTVRFLVNEDTEAFLTEDSVVNRASHVEPTSKAARIIFHGLRRVFGDKGMMAKFTRTWPCSWRVNLGPIGGPVLPAVWRDRTQAIDAEINWLIENFI